MSDNKNSSDFFINLEWNDATEQLLISWADIAACYFWMFDKAYRKFKKLNFRMMAPVIVLSTITGVLGVGLESIFPAEYLKGGQISIGAVNILIGIITTFQNQKRYAQRSEANLIAANDWARLERNIKIELSIERHNRKPATEFIRGTRVEYERLMENSPILPLQVISQFKEKFKDNNILKPEIIEKIEHTIVYPEDKIIDKYRTKIENYSPPKPSILKRTLSLLTGNGSGNNSPDKRSKSPYSKSFNRDSESKQRNYPENEIPIPFGKNTPSISPRNIEKGDSPYIRKDLQRKESINLDLSPSRIDVNLDQDVQDFRVENIKYLKKEIEEEKGNEEVYIDINFHDEKK